MLICRLLPEPLTFPTGISNTDWTAIEVSLVLLTDYFTSQASFSQVCTGEKDPQAYGFKLEIFRKLCTPEITIPVARTEVEKAEDRVYSALWIDTVLIRRNNDFQGACGEAKSTDFTGTTLDREWIISQLCKAGS